jgi:signal transduction histidine kinase
VLAFVTLGQRFRRFPPSVADTAIATGLFLVGSFELLVSGDPGLRSHQASGLALLLLAAVGVAVRRKRPWFGFGAVLLAAAISIVAGIPYAIGNAAFLCELIVLYSVAESSGRIRSVAALVTVLLFDALVQRTVYSVSLPQEIQTGSPYIVLAWFAGYSQRRRRAANGRLEHQAAELEDERRRHARAAIANERTRIARDLHGLVTRGVERMTKLARSARLRLESDAGQVPAILDAIEATGRRTLAEMRRLVTVLRRNEPGPHDEPDDTVGHEPPIATRPPDTWTQAARRTASNPVVADLVLVSVMAALAASEPFSGTGLRYGPAVLVLAALVTAALLLRRRAPLITLAVVAAAVFWGNAVLKTGPYAGDRAMLIAVFTVAVFGGFAWALLAIAVQVVAYAPLVVVPGACDVACQATWTPFFVFAAVAGLAVREAARLHVRIAERMEVIRRTRAERLALAVAEERSRLARDLHDTVAHGVSLMVVQAGAAGAILETDLPRAGRALEAVERAGEQAMQELESLVETLGWRATGHDDPGPNGAPEAIAALVGQASSTGMPVELLMDGERGETAGGLDVSLYRVVQEALTNIRKHAPGANTTVWVRYRPDAVEVEVTNTAPTVRPQELVHGFGHGLAGIAERATLFGGSSESGPTPDGGFRVRASLARDGVKA